MASSAASEIPCPDPSAHKHGKSQNLSEQASTAALYVTNPERQAERENPLGDDGKLSSKSAATSLRYAKPNELPSFPSAGISADSAGKAAMLAKDYKMKDLWHPEASEAGSRAAILAARDGGKLDLWQHTPSAAGNEAATIAMKNKSLSPQLDYGYTADGKSRALLAATLSVNAGRRRAGSTPVTPIPAYPDSKNSAANALSAATASHRASNKAAPDGWNSEANQAARIQNLKAGKEWFGERPPVDIDPEDTKHQAALHASAKSMAKQMYDYQNQKTAAQGLASGTAGAQVAHAGQRPQQTRDVKSEALKYIHLQDAAHKLAQERLAKVDKTMEDAKYREYYGYGGQQQSSPKKQANRLSMRGRQRNRASSEGGSTMDDSDDEQQARRIRTQMSNLGSGLSNVDMKKRTDDRAKLMAAAEKRVHARMHDMDEKVFQDTGKVPPAMMEEWEAKARKRALEDKEMQVQNPGKTHIGGGKFIDTSEIEAIAAARLKPTLDEISDTAQKKRAHDEEVRLEKEEHDRTKREEKAEKKQEKDEQKRVKNEEKVSAKQHKEEDKARKEVEKRDKRKSHDVKREDLAVAGSGTAGSAVASDDIVGHDVEPTSKTDKRTSTLGRIASKLRRKNKSVDERDIDHKPIEERPVTAIRSPTANSTHTIETPIHTSATPVLTAAAVGAGAEAGTGTVAANGAPPTIVEPDTESDADLHDSFQAAHPVTSTISGHSGSHNDAVAMTGLSTARPDLERHISTIETSDEEDGDDWDGDDENDTVQPRQNVMGSAFNHSELSPAHAQAASAPSASVLETAVAPSLDAAPASGGAGLLFPAASEATHIEPASSVSVPRDATDTISQTGPHRIPIANILDPHVPADSEAASSVVLEDFSKSEPVPHTGGASSSITPTVTDATPDVLSTQIPEAQSAPVSQESKVEKAAHIPVTSSTRAHNFETEEPEKKGGLRGFLGKLRNKSSRSENRLSKENKTGASSSIATDSTTARKASAISSELDSTDLDEDELTRGRGRGTAPVKTTGVSSDADRQLSAVSTSNDEETFEEARDHFDESLAPPAAFAGQTKDLKDSGSPVRETKFVEEL